MTRGSTYVTDHADITRDAPSAAVRDQSTPPMRDALTGLHTAAASLDVLETLRSAAKRSGGSVTVVLIDLDRLNRLSHRQSAAVGRELLRSFARIIRAVIQPSDVAGRFQAHQFLILIPDHGERRGVEAVEQCAAGLRAVSSTAAHQQARPLYSAGVVESSPGCLETADQLLQRAGIALTQCKQQGGDRAVTWSELMAVVPSGRSRSTPGPDEVAHWMQRLRQHLRCTYLESIQALVAAMEARDPYTRAHSLTVASYAEAVGRRIGIRGPMLEALHSAGLLHDVGKLAVPEAVLTKPGPLTPEEFNVVKRHPTTAMEILRQVSFLGAEKPMILHHHERFDGTGYPAGLAGDHIPIGARVLAFADALDTMLSRRTYKPAYDLARVRNELAVGSGRQFDPVVVDAATRWIDDVPELFRPA